MFNCIIPYYMSMSIEKLKIKSSLFKLQTKRIVFQRVEKVFLARCRLLRKFLNFVFLRKLLYLVKTYSVYYICFSSFQKIYRFFGSLIFACSQKTKNAKNAVSSILTAFLKPHRQHFVLPPPLTFKWRHIRLIIFGVFQWLYRQPDSFSFFIMLFTYVISTVPTIMPVARPKVTITVDLRLFQNITLLLSISPLIV